MEPGIRACDGEKIVILGVPGSQVQNGCDVSDGSCGHPLTHPMYFFLDLD
jgi:hypothetical protein